MTPADLSAWCAQVARDFHTQEHDAIGHPYGRDASLAEYALEALGDPTREGSAEAFRHTELRRLAMELRIWP